MAKLFVGCRVRILWSNSWPELAGEEGRIIGCDMTNALGPDCEWEVAPDCWGTSLAPRLGIRGAGRFAPSSSQLEPILPEGAAPSEYSYEELMDNLKQMETEA